MNLVFRVMSNDVNFAFSNIHESICVFEGGCKCECECANVRAGCINFRGLTLGSARHTHAMSRIHTHTHIHKCTIEFLAHSVWLLFYVSRRPRYCFVNYPENCTQVIWLRIDVVFQVYVPPAGHANYSCSERENILVSRSVKLNSWQLFQYNIIKNCE